MDLISQGERAGQVRTANSQSLWGGLGTAIGSIDWSKLFTGGGDGFALNPEGGG
jgi:hypothetical protein